MNETQRVEDEGQARALASGRGACLVALVCLALGGYAVAGCSSSRRVSVPLPPGRWDMASDMTPVRIPAWLDLAPELRDAALREVEAAHVPEGYAIVIRDPGAYSQPSSPTGLATGHADLAAHELHVAWRHPRAAAGPLLVALAHEVEHARVWEATHDPERTRCAGHPECGQ